MVVCGKLFQLGCPMDARMKQAPRRKRAPSSRRELGRLGLVAVRAQGEDKGEAKGESDGEKPVERKSRGSRVRKDPVLRRKKVVEKRSAKTEGDAQFDAVNPVSLGRRARKEIDTAWRKFTRLGQFTSTSISEFEVERMVAGKEGLSDLVGMESTGFEVPEAIDTRVLVVGATGQIGRVVLNKLLLRGYTVRAMVQSLSPEVLENFPPSVELIKGDISVMSDAFEATRDCDKVICCARARTNLLAEITRVENEGVKNLVTAMLHHKNEQKTVGQAKQRTNKILLFKFQNHKNTAKFGDWQVNSPGKEGQQGENYANFGYMGSSALPKISTQLPTEEFKSFTFEGSNTDFAETHSPLTLPEGLSLKDCEGLVINCHGNGKKFAVVLYTEDKKGRHGYISEFGTLETGFCTRRVPFSAFTRLTADQPPLNLRDVKDFGLRYRSAWNKDDQEGVEVKESRNFRIKLDWVKALPSGPESDVILVSCSGDQFQGDEAEKERYLKPKRAGEAHLRNSGLGYTVIRPSSLINVPGGQKALLFDQGSRLSGSISSADVADVCIRCLHNGEARNKTFEVSNESDDSASEFELVVHFPDKSDYVTAAVQGLEKNT